MCITQVVIHHVIITFAVMAEEEDSEGEGEAVAVRDLMEDRAYQPSTSSSSVPSPSSSSSSHAQLSAAERNQAFLDSLNEPQNKGSSEDEHGSYIEDVDMFDRDLVLMSTKDLNDLMKGRNIPRERRHQIKQRRRTLKNRGYAATCRERLFDEEEVLLAQISEHEKKLEELAEEERRKRRLAAELQEDREWETALEEYADLIRPGELDGLLKLPGQK